MLIKNDPKVVESSKRLKNDQNFKSYSNMCSEWPKVKKKICLNIVLLIF